MGYNGCVQCSTCNHPRLEEINKDLFERKLKLSEICKKYGNYVSVSGLSTHRSRHMIGYFPKSSIPQLNDQVQMNLGVFGVEPMKQWSAAKINDCTTHVSHPSSETHIHTHPEIHTDKRSIDDLITETKVKSIVLETLKELGIC